MKSSETFTRRGCVRKHLADIRANNFKFWTNQAVTILLVVGSYQSRRHKPLILLWWARQDSNLQPDRYERPALTIELQAPAAIRVRRYHEPAEP